MDKETVLKIIDNLDERIANYNSFINGNALESDQVDFVSGTKLGFELVKSYLQKCIELELSKAED